MKESTTFWQRRSLLTKALIVFFAIMIVRGILIGVGVLPKPESSPQPTVSASLPTPDPTRISMEQYKLLSTGMSYQDVVRLLGSEGTEVSSNEIAGTRTVMYQWKAGFMANMNATFQNDKLVSKAQAGLK